MRCHLRNVSGTARGGKPDTAAHETDGDEGLAFRRRASGREPPRPLPSPDTRVPEAARGREPHDSDWHLVRSCRHGGGGCILDGVAHLSARAIAARDSPPITIASRRVRASCEGIEWREMPSRDPNSRLLWP